MREQSTAHRAYNTTSQETKTEANKVDKLVFFYIVACAAADKARIFNSAGERAANGRIISNSCFVGRSLPCQEDKEQHP